ncbi:serine protein kinase [Vibrio sp. JCM 19053]|nr:serine protein kinase [Vibrio sp. JCM 19053]
MEQMPIYVLTANGERSPVNDHPFCLFKATEDGDILKKRIWHRAPLSSLDHVSLGR